MSNKAEKICPIMYIPARVDGSITYKKPVGVLLHSVPNNESGFDFRSHAGSDFHIEVLRFRKLDQLI